VPAKQTVMRVGLPLTMELIRKSTVSFALRVDVENVPVVVAVLQAELGAEKLPAAPLRFNATLTVPVFVWHDHEVAVIAPIKFMKKLFWLSLVVSTEAVVVLSEPAM